MIQIPFSLSGYLYLLLHCAYNMIRGRGENNRDKTSTQQQHYTAGSSIITTNNNEARTSTKQRGEKNNKQQRPPLPGFLGSLIPPANPT